MKRALPLVPAILLLLASCLALSAQPTLSLPELKKKLEAAEHDAGLEEDTVESPAEAAAWCAAERPYSGQESTLARCLQTWSKRDAEAAIAWTKDLKPTLHDQVVADLARFHRAKLPDVSETFRKQIREDSLRSALAQELRTPETE